SRRGGRYLAVSDLHWGLGRRHGDWHAQEDFRRADEFVRMLERVPPDGRPTTLIVGGDWLELINTLDPGSPVPEVKRLVTAILEGHEPEVRALVEAVTR